MTAARALHLLLVRHARAERRSRRWPDDRRRPLSPSGSAAFSALLRTPRLRRTGVTLVLTSSLRRAASTARLLAGAASPPAQVRVCRALEPGGAPERVLQALRRQGATRIALVGHEPDLSALAGLLTGRAATTAFRKGEVRRLRLRRVEAGAARVVWTEAPAEREDAVR